MTQDKCSLSSLFMQWRGRLAVGFLFGIIVTCSMALYADIDQLHHTLAFPLWNKMLLSLFLVCLGYFGRFWKWQLYMRELAIAIPWQDSARIFFSGLSMALTPGKTGEVIRAYLLLRTHKINFYRSAPTILAERITDLSAMLVLMLAGVWQVEQFYIVFLVGGGIVASFLMLISRKSIFERVLSTIAALPLFGKWMVPIKTMYDSSYILLHGWLLVHTIIISIGAWFMECLALYFILQGLGQMLPLSWVVFAFSASSILGGLSMLPGGLGAAEVSLASLLMMAGLDRPLAIGATVLARFGTLWFGWLLGVLVLGLSVRYFRKCEVNSTYEP